MTKHNLSLSERFWSKVDKKGEDECWNWLGALDSSNYGQIKVNYERVKSNRLAYKLSCGEIPEGICVLHKCDNPKCCNPKHLFLGCHFTNMVDRHNKGRDATGENCGNSVLTKEKVMEIRQMYKTGKYTHRGLGKIFGTCKSNIYAVVNNITW